MVETFFTEKKIIKKIVIVLVFIFMFNFTFGYLGNTVVFADEGDNTQEVEADRESKEGGGKLLLPIHSLLIFVADAFLQILQNTLLSPEPITLNAKSVEEKSVKGIGWVIGGIAVTALAIVCWISPVPGDEVATTSIAGAWWASNAVKIIGGLAVASSLAGPAMTVYGSIKVFKNLRGEFKLPNIWYTPEQIFRGGIPLFDINFFNPNKDLEKDVKKIYEDGEDILATEGISKSKSIINTVLFNRLYAYYGDELYNKERDEVYEKIAILTVAEVFINQKDNLLKKETNMSLEMQQILYEILIISANKSDNLDEKINEAKTLLNFQFENDGNDQDYTYDFSVIINENSQAKVTIGLSDITAGYKGYSNGDPGFSGMIDEIKYAMPTIEKARYQSTAGILQSTISSMYKTLRTIAIVVLLSILVYVGIRIVISSASKDKAKYKQMLMDWLVAFIMLFVLHYMMAFIVTICETLTEVFSDQDTFAVPLEIPGDTQVKNNETGEWGYLWADESAPGYGIWPTTFVGYIRWEAGLVQKDRIYYEWYCCNDYVFSSYNRYCYIYFSIYKKSTIYGISNYDITISSYNLSNR